MSRETIVSRGVLIVDFNSLFLSLSLSESIARYFYRRRRQRGSDEKVFSLAFEILNVICKSTRLIRRIPNVCDVSRYATFRISSLTASTLWLVRRARVLSESPRPNPRARYCKSRPDELQIYRELGRDGMARAVVRKLSPSSPESRKRAR